MRNLKTNKSGAQATNEQIIQSLMSFQGKNVAVREKNGRFQFNASQMAKQFNTKPDDWLRTKQSKSLLLALKKETSHICEVYEIENKTGRNSITWFDEELAILFAQWLSPEFYIACNRKLKELLSKQALVLLPKYGTMPVIIDGKQVYPYTDAMRNIGGCLSGASRRKLRHPNHFTKAFGRNFITEQYYDFLNQFYVVKQLVLDFEKGGNNG